MKLQLASLLFWKQKKGSFMAFMATPDQQLFIYMKYDHAFRWGCVALMDCI